MSKWKNIDFKGFNKFKKKNHKEFRGSVNDSRRRRRREW